MSLSDKAQEDFVSEKAKSSSSNLPEIEKTATVDTVHNDEAIKVLANYTGDEVWTDEEERKLLRRIDWKLMPILCVTYGLQYYDKAMLFFGLREDLHLDTGNRYSFSAAILYLGFMVGAYPAMTLAQIFPIERVASCIITLWGICLILTPVCFNYQSLYVQRFFLGLLESGISPMFMLIVGGWYKKNEQALRMGLLPLVNYGLGHITGSLSPWKYMYFVAGAPEVSTSVNDTSPSPDYASTTPVSATRIIKKGQVFELLGDGKFWLVFFIAFLSMIANGPISTFTPIIINSFGFNTLNSLLLVIPQGFLAGSYQLIAPYLAYKFSENGVRSWIIFTAQMITTLAAILLVALPLDATGGLLFACYILPAIGGGYAVLMGLQIANIAGYTKRSIASSGLYIGYCLGNFTGPLVYKPKDAPRYVPGFITVVVTSFAAGILMLVYRFVCVWENRKRDQSGTAEGYENAYQDDLTDKTNPQFRYIL
ncbi:hypothetical protein N7450_010571 [Penicillium hetheringtonii]|uniref:Major facilitator superfamily (MFS) profile domain-containing protein n=1 Tax=Penicillium hetheringtonii TaxID=911720 RepID=A0AAD6GMI8_9EURO|nr:hypothetical protein N7450_010571 [Penicillium hetheringtonii]